MYNKIHILSVGYSRSDPLDTKSMRANCSCSLVQTRNGRNIIVDTMTAWDGDFILQALNQHNLQPKDIHYVVCTHGHSDHIGCNYLFPDAEWHFVGSCMSHKDKYPDWSWEQPFPLDGSEVQIISTPGHTLSCVSVLVQNTDATDGGTVGICGDLFERQEDISDPELWLGAGSENAKLQKENRLKLAELCSFIIPGHGEGFPVTDEIRHKLKLDLNDN